MAAQVLDEVETHQRQSDLNLALVVAWVLPFVWLYSPLVSMLDLGALYVPVQQVLLQALLLIDL